jgi:hypothetical protein
MLMILYHLMATTTTGLMDGMILDKWMLTSWLPIQLTDVDSIVNNLSNYLVEDLINVSHGGREQREIVSLETITT